MAIDADQKPHTEKPQKKFGAAPLLLMSAPPGRVSMKTADD
ncbi:MAG: hypothetical protein R3C42_01625 [Parvularculaceae bacterium]